MQAYLPVIPSILAVISALVALVVAQFFRDNMMAKVILVAAAALCGAGAIGATLYTQHQIVTDRVAETRRQKEIREQLGTFIAEGLALIADCGDNNKPVPQTERTDWISRIIKFLDDRMGHSYVVRLTDSAGVPVNVACRDADRAHNDFFRVVYAVNFHLEKFSEQPNL